MGCWLRRLLASRRLSQAGLDHAGRGMHVASACFWSRRLTCLLCLLLPSPQLLHIGKQTQEHLRHGLLLLPPGAPQHQGM